MLCWLCPADYVREVIAPNVQAGANAAERAAPPVIAELPCARGHADGMDVVQVNMTNTSNLPIEAMEMEFPLRVERYELVPDSGGAGRYRGGLGVLRDLRVLANDATVALRSARAIDTYVSKGGDVVWEPKFTFHGFRYVELS